MFNPWDALDAQLHDANLQAFGEPFAFVPRLQRPNKPSIPDPNRSGADCVPAVFMRPHSDVRLKLHQTEIDSRDPELEVNSCHLPAEVRQGDWFIRAADGSIWEVSVARANGHGRLKISLLQIGTSPNAP